jgi:NAD+ dependent glucose-6-phosphate dehydrogenase
MMSRVVITGSKGTIGSVLEKGLRTNHEVIGLDLPESDISSYALLLEQLKGADTVIHVAHSANESTRENWRSGRIDPANVLLEMNVLTAVIEARVGRLIMASSVHADNFNAYEGSELLTIPGSYQAASPYGTHKLIVEEMGRFYATHYGFDYIGVRFGGDTPDNSVHTHLKEPAVWLSHRDLVNAIEACVKAETVPGKFAVFYAVSNNDGRIHSTENPFGWQPLDNSKDHLAR